MADLEVRIDPRAEWAQIFDEAWRINRDYFYAPNMHGADWPAMKKKYGALLPDIAVAATCTASFSGCRASCRSGITRGGGGDRLETPKTVPGGLLGADYEIANGRYRFKKVYGGLNWTPQLRAPLTAPGVNVEPANTCWPCAARTCGRRPTLQLLREHGRQDRRDHRRPES